jgi:hypothetical protein
MSFRAPGLAAVGSGPAADRVMHLYTVEKQSCSGGSAHGEPIVFARDDQSIATWRDSSRFYVLVAQISEDRMERFLKGDLALADVTATIPSDAECYTCGEEGH